MVRKRKNDGEKKGWREKEGMAGKRRDGGEKKGWRGKEGMAGERRGKQDERKVN